MMYQYERTTSTQSLYVHWPFCPYKCHFCPFVALASHDSYMPAYHAALVREITFFATLQTIKAPLKTIFFGGGTPSTYPLPLLSHLFDTLKNFFIYDENSEITIEVNPGTVNDEALITWKSLGINRLSIGVQALDDEILARLGRHQKKVDVLRLIDSASPIFNNISIDLIIGLPLMTDQAWKAMLHEIVTWPINHISLYFLTVHEDTPLYFKVKKGVVTLPHEEKLIDLYFWSCDLLRSHGFTQYELSNFAKPGAQSMHNTVYWERNPYKGFGLGACSFDGVHRIQNDKNLMSYINKINSGESTTFFSEKLSVKQVFLEKLMLGLRCARGACYTDVTNLLTPEEQRIFCNRLEEFIVQGHVYRDEKNMIRLTNTGLLLENYIVSQLMQ